MIQGKDCMLDIEPLELEGHMAKTGFAF